LVFACPLHPCSSHGLLTRQTLAEQIYSNCGNFTPPFTARCAGSLAQMEASLGSASFVIFQGSTWMNSCMCACFSELLLFFPPILTQTDFDIYNIYDDCGDDQMSHSLIRERLRAPVVTLEDTRAAFALHPSLNLGGALNDYKVGA
jgi:hypothetical protein